eukprot:11194353-Lingulodinium_polyedra.AAC.1
MPARSIVRRRFGRPWCVRDRGLRRLALHRGRRQGGVEGRAGGPGQAHGRARPRAPRRRFGGEPRARAGGGRA